MAVMQQCINLQHRRIETEQLLAQFTIFQLQLLLAQDLGTGDEHCLPRESGKTLTLMPAVMTSSDAITASCVFVYQYV